MVARTDLEILLQSNVNQNKAIFDRQNGNGILMISGNAVQTPTAGTYYAVHFVTDCTPTTFTATNSTLITGVLYPAGTVMYVDVTAITCGASDVYSLYKV